MNSSLTRSFAHRYSVFSHDHVDPSPPSSSPRGERVSGGLLLAKSKVEQDPEPADQKSAGFLFSGKNE
jgi:hypothetical protein